jgi:hypothetical protein
MNAEPRLIAYICGSILMRTYFIELSYLLASISSSSD